MPVTVKGYGDPLAVSPVNWTVSEVAPLLHWYVFAPETTTCALAPSQMVTVSVSRDKVTPLITFTVSVRSLVQPVKGSDMIRLKV